MLTIIGGKHKRRKLAAPKSDTVRPTASQLRETVFNICQHAIEGARFLDLFAGSGAMGLEALSRGAAHATFIEQGRTALRTLKQNIATLGEEEHARVVAGDVSTVLPRLEGPFDVIYVDPPYSKGLSAAVLEQLDALPLLAEGGHLFFEDTPFEPPPLTRFKLKKKRKVGRATLLEFTHS